MLTATGESAVALGNELRTSDCDTSKESMSTIYGLKKEEEEEEE